MILVLFVSLAANQEQKEETASLRSPTLRKLQSLSQGETIYGIQYEPGSDSYAIIARDREDFVVLLNGKEVGRHYSGNQIFVPEFKFSSSGRRYGYLAYDAAKARYFVVTDGKKGQTYQRIYSFHFSSDGKHYGYVAHLDVTPQFAVIDGAEKKHDAVDSFQFSRDGFHYGYVASIGGYLASSGRKQFVVIDGREGPLYENIRSLQLSTDGTHWGYLAQNDFGEALIIDSGEVHKFQGLETWMVYFANSGNTWVLAPNGQRYAFVYDPALRGIKSDADLEKMPLNKKLLLSVNVDGREDGLAYDNVHAFHFSPDSQRYLLIAYESCPSINWYKCNGGDGAAVIDGKKGKVYLNVIFFDSGFSPMSTRYWYVVREECPSCKTLYNQFGAKYFAVIDGKEEQKHDGIASFQFSSDDRHYAYIAHNYGPETEQFVVVVDGKKISDRYSKIHHLGFSADSKFVSYVIQKGSDVYQVRHVLKRDD